MTTVKYTHFTKTGFGGLLKGGLKCAILKQDGESVVIKLKGIRKGNLSIYHGKLKDLTKI